MEYVRAFFDLLETIMGIGLVIFIALGFLSIFGGGDSSRYNGAGTLDQD